MSFLAFLSQIRNLLEKDQVPAALAQLKSLLERSPQLSRVLEQSAKHQVMLKQIISGLISIEQATATKAQIRAELFALIDEIERQQQVPAIQQELDVAIALVMAGDRREARYKLMRLIFVSSAVLLVLTGACLYALRDRIWPESFVLTVFVHGPGGSDDRILKDHGEVWLDIGTARFRQGINKEGEATFKEIPGFYLGDTARLSIDHDQPYKAAQPDSTYILQKGKAIDLEVYLTGLDSVFGYVYDFVTERPLDSVRVSTRDIATYTNAFGWFVLHIPPNARQKFINVDFMKPKYKSTTLYGIAPHTAQEYRISLHPENE